MKKTLRDIEKAFEKLTSVTTNILGHSITFILALIMVLFWWINTLFHGSDVHTIIGDIIFGSTFLCLFIIQKSFNRFSALLHLKINELVLSHESANNSVMNTHEKTESEIIELAKEYIDMDPQIVEEIVEEVVDRITEKNNGEK